MERNCESGEINIPEIMPDYNSPGNIGSWRQILAANIGRFVRIEISPSLSGPLRASCGTIYAVGNAYVALLCEGKTTLVDILAIKYAIFE